MNFLRNNQSYNVVAEGQLASILSYFDKNYVFGVMDDILSARTFTFDLIPKANIAISYEENFKTALSDFPGDKENINIVRNECYYTIIDRISRTFDFEYRGDEDDDLFSISRLLYDFFVSNYNNYVINFLATYIISEKKNLYKGLQLERYKKDKDITTVNNKKLFNDPLIVIITAHMDEVVYYILGQDFTMQDILGVTYGQYPYFIDTMLLHVFPVHDFFKSYVGELLQSPSINPLIITSLKLEVQRRCLPDDCKLNLNF